MTADDQTHAEGRRMRIDKATCASYSTHLVENYRSPSRGGNSRAWHSHVLIIEDEKYSFLAAHRGKLVYKRETVSFEWEWDSSGKYRNVDRNTVIAWDKNGNPIVRGDRRFKTWRTADQPPPGRDD